MALQTIFPLPGAQIRRQPASVCPLGTSAVAASTADSPARRVAVGDDWIAYRIRRSRRRKKTYQISVKDGEVLVAVPHRTTNKQAEEMVLQKAAWILSKLAVERNPARNTQPAFR